MPFEIFKRLNIDIFADRRFDAWVLLTIARRIELNTWEHEEQFADGEKVFYCGLNTCYSLFNHSCSPNVDWSWDTAKGSIVVKSAKKIEHDEEMFISYLNRDQLKLSAKQRRKMLENWMPGGKHFCPSRCDFKSQRTEATAYKTKDSWGNGSEGSDDDENAEEDDESEEDSIADEDVAIRNEDTDDDDMMSECEDMEVDEDEEEV